MDVGVHGIGNVACEREGGRMRVGIFGAGAIGGYLGVCLSAGGAEVVMLGRQDLSDSPARINAKKKIV